MGSKTYKGGFKEKVMRIVTLGGRHSAEYDSEKVIRRGRHMTG